MNNIPGIPQTDSRLRDGSGGGLPLTRWESCAFEVPVIPARKAIPRGYILPGGHGTARIGPLHFPDMSQWDDSSRPVK
jgi:hypothetical protein